MMWKSWYTMPTAHGSSLILFLSSWGSCEPPHYCFEDYICFCWCDSSPFFPISFELWDRISYRFLCKISASAPTEASDQARGDRTWAHTGSTKQKLICSYPWMISFHICIHGFPLHVLLCPFLYWLLAICIWSSWLEYQWMFCDILGCQTRTCSPPQTCICLFALLCRSSSWEGRD